MLSLLLATSCGGGTDPAPPPATTGGTPGRYDPRLVADGKQLYEQSCAVCHGLDLQGTQTGPTFLSPIYAPDHHPDASFFAAVANGVQPHHWDFGPMPPQPNVSSEDVQAIVAYVRTRQAEAGMQEDDSG